MRIRILLKTHSCHSNRLWPICILSKRFSIKKEAESTNPSNVFQTLIDKEKTQEKSRLRLARFWNGSLLMLSLLILYGHYSNREIKPKNLKQKPFTRKGIDDDEEEINSAFKDKTHRPNTNVRFSDCKGMDEIIVEFKQIADLIANRQKYQNLGAAIPRGILLTGPPGTGKTLLAKALASETNCSFLYCSGSDFESKYHGQSAKKVKKLFAEARASSPCIIFIDEIDSVAGKRNTSTAYKNQTLNQLLVEMDGFDSLDEVFLVGATNFEQSLDPALLRAGRFDKIVRIPAPNIKGRREILDHYISKIRCDPKKIEIDRLTKLAIGMTGAQLKNIVNLAAIRAVRVGHKEVLQEDFQFAFDRVMIGLKGKGSEYSTPRQFAIHEAGHALVALCEQNQAVDIIESTILPLNGRPGNTSLIHLKEKENRVKSDLIKEIDIALGGRIAEEILLGKDFISTNCGTDLQKATKLALKVAKNMGGSTSDLVGIGNDDIMSDDLKYILEKEAASLLSQRSQLVRDLLTSRTDLLLRISAELLKKETLTKAQIVSIINN